jgi:hypothetical protein
MSPIVNQIVASLEGMKVVVRENHCELHEYNFETNSWSEIERLPWPIARAEADRWLTNWNSVDQLAARSILSGPCGP